MEAHEIELFRQLCNYKREYIDQKLLKNATPELLGYLFFNRMHGVAYDKLKINGMLGCVNREFRNSLLIGYENNISKNNSFHECVVYLSKILEDVEDKYAMLKGAFLCDYYPKGYRTSNDIDLLVATEHVSEVGDVLKNNGFLQGNIRNGVFVPASRAEIISSRMQRGETVPYIKEINLPGMKYLEIDINFSLDYKNSEFNALESFLSHATKRDNGQMVIKTLSEEDFFIHLCAHLYKEASTMPWVEMQRDMTLYKYCDIYTLLYSMDKTSVDRVFNRADELGMKKICAYVILQTAELFDVENEYSIFISRDIMKQDPLFLHTVIAPAERKQYLYTEKDITKRFYCKNRKSILEEVVENA